MRGSNDGLDMSASSDSGNLGSSIILRNMNGSLKYTLDDKKVKKFTAGYGTG